MELLFLICVLVTASLATVLSTAWAISEINHLFDIIKLAKQEIREYKEMEELNRRIDELNEILSSHQR